MRRKKRHGAPAPTQLSKLTDSELEQEFVQLLGHLDDEQRGAVRHILCGLSGEVAS